VCCRYRHPLHLCARTETHHGMTRPSGEHLRHSSRPAPSRFQGASPVCLFVRQGGLRRPRSGGRVPGCSRPR
jgi:hypothetical protein